MNQVKIGKFLKELRKEKNMTQQDLADILDITDKAISKWENGRCLPDLYFLQKLTEIFNVSEKEILNGERNFKKKKVNKQQKILEINNLSKLFGKKKVLDNINMDIYEGEIVGLVGPNGAGKTTLIKTIISLYKKDFGTIKINGYNIEKEYEKALSNVGFILDTPLLYSDISGRDNLKITEILNKNNTIEYTNDIIKLVKLENKINDKVKNYSIGMKQRLGIANTLLKRPKILIFDEPTNGLDPIGIKDLREILKRLSIENNIGILISSHLLMEIENLCDRVIIINEGKIKKEFGIEEIKYKNMSLEEKYLKEVEENYNGNN